MELYIVRHGLCRHNLTHYEEVPFDPVFAEIEENDCSLCPQGVIQTQLTGMRLSDTEFDAVLVSPFHRTLETAAGILKYQKKKLAIEVMPSLVELGTSPEYRMMPEHLAKKVWPDIRLVHPYDMDKQEGGYESFLRAKRVVKYVRERFREDEKVLIVSHTGFIGRYLIANFLGLPDAWTVGHTFGIANCSITRFTFGSDGRVIMPVINYTGHLGETITADPFFG